MDLTQRRQLLQCRANPDPGRDYVSELSGHIKASEPDGSYRVRIRYVPDRLILDPENLSSYFTRLGGEQWTSLESLTTTLLGDLRNEAVPRWVQVCAVSKRSEGSLLDVHSTTAEDQQPGWRNDDLLSRLDI